MFKKLVPVCVLFAVIMALGSTVAFAQDKNFSFSVTPADDSAFTAPNPKDDSEQRAYIVTQNNNIVSADLFYYTVRRAPSRTATMVCDWVQCYGSGTLTPYYSLSYCSTGTNLYLEGNTDKYNVYAEGHWWS